MANMPDSLPAVPAPTANNMASPSFYTILTTIISELLETARLARSNASNVSTLSIYRSNLTEEINGLTSGSTYNYLSSSLCGGLGVKMAWVTGGTGKVVQPLPFTYSLTGGTSGTETVYSFVIPTGGGTYSLHLVGGAF